MISVKNLTRRYGTFTAVDNLSFEVKPGVVTGFLGPNGSGKSTTMRMLCGLTTPTSGTSTVLGQPYTALANPGRHVGLLLDASAQHVGRTGRETLLLAAILLGVDRSRVDAMLDLVGLTSREAERRVGAYSLGMRQRLGLAVALIGDPEVLVLDEPANGLDPAGIRWMRDLLHGFASNGGTVLLSSHLLTEIEKVAHELLVIGRGRLVAQGTKDQLLSRGGTIVRAEGSEAFAQTLRAAGLTVSAASEGGMLVSAEPIDVGRLAAAHGAVLLELRPAASQGLEDLFLELTAADARETVA